MMLAPKGIHWKIGLSGLRVVPSDSANNFLEGNSSRHQQVKMVVVQQQEQTARAGRACFRRPRKSGHRHQYSHGVVSLVVYFFVQRIHIRRPYLLSSELELIEISRAFQSDRTINLPTRGNI